MSTQDHHEVLKSELGRRDETIQKLRRDVLALQDKRDSAVAEVGTALGWPSGYHQVFFYGWYLIQVSFQLFSLL